MLSGLDLVTTIAAALFAALVFGLFTQRIGLSPIVGYLLAGVAVGPFTPGFIAHAELAHELAEVGVVLLMFGVGLQFRVEELLAVRRVALPGAILGIAVGAAAGFAVATFAGWSFAAGATFALATSVTSTVVLLRVLADRGELQTRAGHLAIGWLVTEDLIAVLALVLVPLLTEPSRGVAFVGAIALAIAKVAVLIAFTLVAGAKLVPWLLGRVAKTRARDLFTLAVLVLALGIALGASRLFGASMALGAFLAGTVVGRSDFAARAASEAMPMRDAFAVLFFVSVGMMLDPRALLSNAPLIAATFAAVLVAKPLAAFIVMRVRKEPPRTAVLVALSLAQIGEFSFIVAASGHLPSSTMQILVAVSMLSITLSPLLVRLANPLAAHLPAALDHDAGEIPPDRERAIVVGHGPVGRTVTRILRDRGIEPTVIDMNHEVVEALRASGMHAVHGDATRRDVLEHAGIRTARSLIFAASGSGAGDVARIAKELNPTLNVLARTTYLRDLDETTEAGADTVIVAETEIAHAMTAHLLGALPTPYEAKNRLRAGSL